MPLITAIVTPRRGSKARSIELDGETWRGVAASVVAQLGLAEGDDVSTEDLSRRLDEIEPSCARDRAYALLSYRDRTESALTARLIADGFPVQVAQATVARLVSLDFVNDHRYAESRARSLTQVRGLGRSRAVRELVNDGVPPEIAAEALTQALDADDEYATALALACATARRTGATRDKSIARLLRRGFSPSIAIRASREAFPYASGDDPEHDESVALDG